MEQSVPRDALLRPVAVSDGELSAPSQDTPVACATLLATCARESTGADRVAASLAQAAFDWITTGDVKRVRSVLLRIAAELD